MTEDIRITAVQSAAPSGWTIRGTRIGLPNIGGAVSIHTDSRLCAATCIGAKVLDCPVHVRFDVAGDVVAVSVL